MAHHRYSRAYILLLALALVFSSQTLFAQTQSTAALTVPANGATGVDPGTMLTWAPVNGATSYQVVIGTSAGASDVYDSGKIAGPSFPALTLLSNATYYVRLFTYTPGTSSYSDSSFTTGTGMGVLRYPADGATGLDGRHMLFTWSSDPTASCYYLYVGTTAGAKDVVDSGETTANYWVSTSSPFQPNTTYYATLWVKRNGHWAGTSTTLTTGAPSGELLYPAAGATSVDPTQGNFSWSPVTFANNYYLIIGSAVGQNDVLDSGQITGTNLVVGNLLGGRTYYARFYSQLAGRWSYLDSTFQTGPVRMPASPAALYSQVIGLISQVRAMADPHTNIPVPGTLLESKTFARGKSTAYCTDYANTLLQLLENQQIAARTRNIVFDPLDTHVINEFYDPFQSKWVIADPTFGAMYFDSSTLAGNSVEEISSLVVDGNWSAIPLKWVTSYGESIWDQYYLDPILLFLNPLSVSPVTVPVPVPNDPNLLVSPETISQTGGAAGTYIFRFAQPTDVVTISNPGHSQFTLGVTPPTKEWGLAQVLSTGWSAISAPAGLLVYSPPRVFGAAQLTYPANGAANVPLSTTIAWTSVASSTSYSLLLGTTPGGSDALNLSGITATTLPVQGLAADTVYYLRLVTSHSAMASSATTASFITIGGGVIVSPANGATGINPAAVLLQWTPSKSATSYEAWIGTSPSAKDVYDTGQLSGTTATVSNLVPKTIYWIRIWVNRSGVWSYTDSSFTTALPGIVTTPANGATGVNPGTVTITWTPDSTAIVYYPYLGTSQGANDVFNYGEQPAASTSVIARQLASYTTYWIRMWIKRSAGWSYTDSHFTTGPADGTVISPANGATGVNPGAVTITWTPDSTALVYYPYLGTSQGANDVFNYGEQPAASTSVIARQLASYTTYWIRMWIKRNGVWSYTADSHFTTGPANGTVISPANGASGVNPGAVTISWTPDSTATVYYPYIGTSQGANDVINFGEQPANSTSVHLQNLAPGTTYWIRMWIDRSGTWYYTDSIFTTGPTSP